MGRRPVKLKDRKPRAEIQPRKATRREKLRVNNLMILLDDGQFEKCVKRITFQEFLTGETIIDADDEGGEVYFVVEGKVRVVDGMQEGRDLVYNDIEEGGWFGELAAVDERSRSATISALTNVIVATLPREVFLNMILECRAVALKVLGEFSGFIRAGNRRTAKVSSFTGVQRVYMELLQLAEPDPRGDGTWHIPTTVKHKGLAAEASTSLEIVARALSQLLKKGLIKREGGSFRILDREQIQQMITQN